MPTLNRQLRWQADLGTSHGGAPGRLITGDQIIIAAGSAVVCLNRYTGAQNYRYALSFDPRCICSFGSQLVVTDDRNDSTLYVLDRKTGRAQRLVSVQGSVNWMLGVGKQLFAATDKKVYLIELRQRHWQVVKQGGPGSIAPAVYSGGLLYCTTGDGSVVCFDLNAFAV